MITSNHLTCLRSRMAARTALMALAIALPLTACGSGTMTAAGAAPSAPASETAAVEACQQVSAVLTDGPDADVDPVGYAEAQILPLRQIRTPDTALGTAIAGLASAYSGYSA